MKYALFITILLSFQISFSLSENTEIGYVEVLIIANTTKSIESSFGHSSLLIIPKGKKWYQGTILSFGADITKYSQSNTESESKSYLSYVKDGLIGNFPLSMEERNANSYFYKALYEENRSVKRYLLTLTSYQKELLLKNILAIKKNPKILGQYYFHIKNCATSILKLLSDSNIPTSYVQNIVSAANKGFSPEQLPEMLKKNMSYIFPAADMDSYEVQITKIEKKYNAYLGSELDMQQNYLPWKRPVEASLNQMSSYELYAVLYGLSNFDQKRKPLVINLLKKRKKSDPNIFQYIVYPKSFYESCSDIDCLETKKIDIEKTYLPVEVKEIIAKMYETLFRSKRVLLGDLKYESVFYSNYKSLVKFFLKN